jgi:hypothetical protein
VLTSCGSTWAKCNSCIDFGQQLGPREKAGEGWHSGKKDRESGQAGIHSKRNLIYPMVQIKQAILDPSDVRNKHVSIKTDAFQRDLHIHGLRSSIRVTVQKVKFWSTPVPLSNQT